MEQRDGAASYEARVFGVRSAMPATRAERLCPQLIFVPPETADFHTLTRSLTPPQRPLSAHEVANIACALRERVERPADSRYRLVGVGLAGFVDADSYQAQSDLFA